LEFAFNDSSSDIYVYFYSCKCIKSFKKLAYPEICLITLTRDIDKNLELVYIEGYFHSSFK